MISTQEHQAKARKQYPHVECAIITVSDTRNEANDTSGQAIRDLLNRDSHPVTYYMILKDEPRLIVGAIEDLITKPDVGCILLNGGTGIGKRDSTVDAVVGLFDKTLVGFGELFRMISYGEIGSAAMMSRAVAGVYKNKIIFSLPGSTHAVKLAMEKLILPELAHLVWELKK